MRLCLESMHAQMSGLVCLNLSIHCMLDPLVRECESVGHGLWIMFCAWLDWL